MQKLPANFLIIFFISLSGSVALFAQTTNYRLQKADSLFEARRYTQALNHFQVMLDNNQYTPAMLLKMAYINEALGKIAEAQYFLNLYYLATNDDSVLEKMEELALAHGLEGYTVTETDRIFQLYQRNSAAVVLVLMAVVMLLFAWTTRTLRAKQRAIGPAIVLVSFCVLLVVAIQYSSADNHSIIIKPNTYLMSGPSAGANVIEIADKGHRVTVLGKKDVWIKVQWNNQVVYLKEGALLPVSL